MRSERPYVILDPSCNFSSINFIYFNIEAVKGAIQGSTLGMFVALIEVAGSATLFASSGSQASSLERELQRKVQVSHELEAQMQKVRNLLEGAQTEEQKLVAFIYYIYIEMTLIVLGHRTKWLR